MTADTSDIRKVKLKLSPQAEKYARRDAPVEVRLMAARGALPLEPLELATVLFVLASDSEPEVKDTARRSLESLPDPILATALRGPAHPALLSFMAQIHKEHENHCEAIALNNATDDPTIAWLATLPHSRVVDIISQNQARMLRHEEIVDALGANPLTGRAVIERILGFLGATGVTELAGAPAEDGEVSEEDAEAALLALLGEDMAHLVRPLAQEEASEEEAATGNLYAAIQQMTVMQKVKLARLGGKDARTLLIRDRNKIVSTAVVLSPKITESEITAISQSRNVADDVLRLIANNRDWTKSYKVKLALSTNPKTPQATALKFLNYLHDRDLKILMKSRDVPSVITAQSRKILERKGKI